MVKCIVEFSFVFSWLLFPKKKFRLLTPQKFPKRIEYCKIKVGVPCYWSSICYDISTLLCLIFAWCGHLSAFAELAFLAIPWFIKLYCTSIFAACRLYLNIKNLNDSHLFFFQDRHLFKNPSLSSQTGQDLFQNFSLAITLCFQNGPSSNICCLFVSWAVSKW